MKSALIMIRLSIPRSGSPDDNAVIYDMPDEEAIRWHSMVECNSDEVAEAEVSQACIRTSNLYSDSRSSARSDVPLKQ